MELERKGWILRDLGIGWAELVDWLKSGIRKNVCR